MSQTVGHCPELTIRHLGLQDYEYIYERMLQFTLSRDSKTPDEIWLLEHKPVFTLGQAAKPEHVLRPGDIPVVQTDRGGQVTYHGPGQLVAYFMLDVKRNGLGIRQLVSLLEQAVVSLVGELGLDAYARSDAPGVYVKLPEPLRQEAKLAALGLRIKRGCSFHGLSLNVDMDLEPFNRINPCGFSDMLVTQLKNLVSDVTLLHASELLVQALMQLLNYKECHHLYENDVIHDRYSAQ